MTVHLAKPIPATAGDMPGIVLQTWHFQVQLLPPGNNHAYRLTEQRGAKALTRDALATRQVFTLAAIRAGFEPRLEALYHVAIVFTMPSWGGGDIDGPIKHLLDSVFTAPGHRQAWDHRITRLEVEKRVERGCYRTDVTITEVSE